MVSLVTEDSKENTRDQSNIGSTILVDFTEKYTDIIKDYADVFHQELSDQLPPQRAFKFEINTDPVAPPL